MASAGSSALIQELVRSVDTVCARTFEHIAAPKKMILCTRKGTKLSLLYVPVRENIPSRGFRGSRLLIFSLIVRNAAWVSDFVSLTGSYDALFLCSSSISRLALDNAVLLMYHFHQTSAGD